MTLKEAFKIMLVAALFLVFEAFLYLATRMPRALETAAPTFVIAYLFQWLMVLTSVIAITAPLSAWLEHQSEKPRAGLFCWVIFTAVAMILFTTFSFLKVSSKFLPLGPPAAADKRPPALKLSQIIKFTGFEMTLVDPETMKMSLHFQNRSTDEFTELDYLFVALEGTAVFYNIKIRQPIHLPPEHRASATLTWKKSSFKDRALFDRLQDAYTKKTLRILAKPSRAVRLDGKTIEE